jgi:ComF family protein
MLAIKKIIDYKNDFASLFFPKICVGCGSDTLSNNQTICFTCITEMPTTNFEQHADNLVSDLFTGRIALLHACSYVFFSKDSLVQHLIHNFKYKANKELGHAMGSMMGHAILQANWPQKVDAIIPIPLNKIKQQKRGFNQAEILANGIAAVLEKPVETVAILRNKHTETQTRKTRADRWSNVAEVFDITDTNSLINKHVLLVDDVVTTGATLEACGKELLKINGLKLSIATFAFASKF